MTRRFLLCIVCLLQIAFPSASRGDVWERPYPWTEAGLSDEQAAAHLLDRLTYGPRPGQIEEIVRFGVAEWIEGQLAGDLEGADLEVKLVSMPGLDLTTEQIYQTYGNEHDILQKAIAAGAVDPVAYSGKLGASRRESAVRNLRSFAVRQGLKPQSEWIELMRNQKIFRAVYSKAQLKEVLVDFWFNHFNVSIRSAAFHTQSYERDAIRPHVFGRFHDLLRATARHPAMLIYLGNAESVAEHDRETLLELAVESFDQDFSPTEDVLLEKRLARAFGWRDPQLGMDRRTGRNRGLNENYARELFELHTLGVDGGYRQRDVVEAARVFTGWSHLPPQSDYRERFLPLLEQAADLGFVVDGEFVFRADQHDSEAKSVLGVFFPPGGGVDEGERILEGLAVHPSTRRFLAEKLAVRFVDDEPPASLIDRLATTWELTDGDLRQVTRALIASPEFWRARVESRRKIKTPLELTVSALRAVDAEIDDPGHVLWRLGRMGQTPYDCTPPTGYSNRGRDWVDAGGLRERMQFAVHLADGRIDGVRVDLRRLLEGRPTDSFAEAMLAYRPLLLPEREVVDQDHWDELAAEFEAAEKVDRESMSPEERRWRDHSAQRYAAHAVSVLLASPEFQTK